MSGHSKQGWTAYSPLAADAPAPARPASSAGAAAAVARVTVEIFSKSPGDASVSVWVAKGGPLAAAQAEDGERRIAALRVLKEITDRELNSAITALAR